MTFSNIMRNRLPALDRNEAHEQLETIQIMTHVLEQSKPRDYFNLFKVQLELCYISQVPFSLILSPDKDPSFPLYYMGSFSCKKQDNLHTFNMV